MAPDHLYFSQGRRVRREKLDPSPVASGEASFLKKAGYQ
jgi:hypothetical protein